MLFLKTLDVQEACGVPPQSILLAPAAGTGRSTTDSSSACDSTLWAHIEISGQSAGSDTFLKSLGTHILLI